MKSEQITPTLEITERHVYQAPKLEHHGDYTARVGGGGSIDFTPGEFWDTDGFWDDLNKPSF